MKINFKVRSKNPACIVLVVLSCILPVLAYGGVELSSLTTWKAVGDAFMATLNNPYALLTILLSVTGATIDPTSSGLTDSARALDYGAPADSKDNTIATLTARIKQLEAGQDDKD